MPPRFSETGKRLQRFFSKREDAAKFISDVNRRGNVGQVELDETERTVLATIRSSERYSPQRLALAWRRHMENGNDEIADQTLRQLAEAFLTRQIKEKRSPHTLSDDRWRLNRLAAALGKLEVRAVTPADLRKYFEEIGPGTNRRSHHKTLRKLFKWAFDLDYVAVDPMAKIKATDKWGINDESIKVETFKRLLRVCAGLEEPRKGLKVTEKLAGLVPYFVLGGLAGMRRCELVSHYAGDPVIEWSDILWDENLIQVRDEVAKQTRAKDRLRYIPLEPAARAILEPLKGEGRIVPVSHGEFGRLADLRRETMKLKLPKNCLRNSYATYAQTFRPTSDVAKAMGDQESTVKRFYTVTLKPESGRAWFDVSLQPTAEAEETE